MPTEPSPAAATTTYERADRQAPGHQQHRTGGDDEPGGGDQLGPEAIGQRRSGEPAGHRTDVEHEQERERRAESGLTAWRISCGSQVLSP